MALVTANRVEKQKISINISKDLAIKFDEILAKFDPKTELNFDPLAKKLIAELQEILEPKPKKSKPETDSSEYRRDR